MEKVGFARALCFISANNKQRKEDREKAATDNIGGLHCCKESQGQIKCKLVRAIPLFDNQ